MEPDKLYVEISGDKDSSVYWIGRTSSVPQSDDSVEYIRKDALLEWAKSEIEKDECVLTLEDLIDKINSL